MALYTTCNHNCKRCICVCMGQRCKGPGRLPLPNQSRFPRSEKYEYYAAVYQKQVSSSLYKFLERLHAKVPWNAPRRLQYSVVPATHLRRMQGRKLFRGGGEKMSLVKHFNLYHPQKRALCSLKAFSRRRWNQPPSTSPTRPLIYFAFCHAWNKVLDA